LRVEERHTACRSSIYNGESSGLIIGELSQEQAIRYSAQTRKEIMRAALRRFLACVLLLWGGSVIGMPSAKAQSPGSRSSLGGYGATASGSMASMGVGGPIIPYAGNFGGFMPYRMGGGSSLSFQSRGASAMESTRTSFSLGPMTSGTTSMSGGMGQGFGARLLLPAREREGAH
jgi:hypothetical protein